MVEAITFQQLSLLIKEFFEEPNQVLSLWLDCSLKIKKMGIKGSQVKSWRATCSIAEKQLSKCTMSAYSSFACSKEFTEVGEELIERFNSDNMKATVMKKFENGGKCFMIMSSMFATYLNDLQELLVDLENHAEAQMTIASIVNKHKRMLTVMRAYIRSAFEEIDIHQQLHILLAIVGKVFGYEVVQPYQPFVPASEGENFQLFLSDKLVAPPKKPLVRNALLRRKIANVKMQELKPSKIDK